MLSLLSERVLKCVGWLYSMVGAYAFNELFSFGDVDHMLLDVDIIRDKGWLHNVF